jgi:hypothetical protein
MSAPDMEELVRIAAAVIFEVNAKLLRQPRIVLEIGLDHDRVGWLVSPLNSTSTGSLGLFGFHENHSSEPGLRMVGRSRSNERWLRLCASSTQAMSNPSSDLIESAVWFCIPWNMMTPPPGVRISASSISKPGAPKRLDLVLDQQLDRVLEALLNLADTGRSQARSQHALLDQRLGEEVRLARAAPAVSALVARRR